MLRRKNSLETSEGKIRLTGNPLSETPDSYKIVNRERIFQLRPNAPVNRSNIYIAVHRITSQQGFLINIMTGRMRKPRLIL